MKREDDSKRTMAKSKGDKGKGSMVIAIKGETGETSGRNRRANRPKELELGRIDLPLFDGEDPNGLLFKAKHYYTFNRISKEKRLETIMVRLSGDSLAWYQWTDNETPF